MGDVIKLSVRPGDFVRAEGFRGLFRVIDHDFGGRLVIVPSRQSATMNSGYHVGIDKVLEWRRSAND